MQDVDYGGNVFGGIPAVRATGQVQADELCARLVELASVAGIVEQPPACRFAGRLHVVLSGIVARVHIALVFFNSSASFFNAKCRMYPTLLTVRPVISLISLYDFSS